MLEDNIVSIIKKIYASFGFVPIETPAVEMLSTLAAKGVVEREIYLLRRAQAEPGDESDLALHFDLTVPFARYVAQHYNELKFPFKRYQLQKVWRGERPQKGRFREFYQFDIDMVARDELPMACDAEMLTVLERVFSALHIGRFSIAVNNRKLLLGLYRSLGLNEAQSKSAISAVDKMRKIGKENVVAELSAACGVPRITAQKVVDSTAVSINPKDAAAQIDALGVKDDLFSRGKEEVGALFALLPESALDRFYLDLSLARGLDYYTGTIFETYLADFPEFGSVGGGGRYDDLASQFINKKLPGVGFSIGITRLMDLVFNKNIIPLHAESPALVLIAVYSEEQRAQCNRLADQIRGMGVAAEVFYKSPKLGKQLDYAADKRIPHVMFVNPQTGELEAKNLATKEQIKVVDLANWCKKVS